MSAGQQMAWQHAQHCSSYITTADSLPPPPATTPDMRARMFLCTQAAMKQGRHRRSSASAGPQPLTRPASPRLSLTARAADRARFDSDAARRAQQAEVSYPSDPSLAPSLLHLLQLIMVISAGVPSQQQDAASYAEQLRLRCALAVPNCTLHVPHRRSSAQRRRCVQSARLPSWPPTARRLSSRWAQSAGQGRLALAASAEPYLLHIVCYLPQHQLAAGISSQL